MADLSERLRALYTGVVYDTLSDLGMAGQALPSKIQALDPERTLAGPIWTLSGRRAPHISRDESLLSWAEFLSAAPAGHVVVCQPNDKTIALMGELSAETLKSHGVLGYVVDGSCRDVDFILKLGFPVFCSGRTPADIAGRWSVGEMGTGVRIGHLDIHSGDYLSADKDGAVVIPQAQAETVIAKAKEAVVAEDKVRDAILSGTDPKEAYLKFGKF
ncbi:MAG: RraA family protein [Alphaproteobacteria bacterium]|nr:RraA family protein [Alphaproteobacteria bacterium]